MKYRIRCGDLYYCGMAWKEGRPYQRWEKESCFANPLETNLSDAECTLAILLETGKFTEMPTIVEVNNE